jgi:phosphoserine phosphatase
VYTAPETTPASGAAATADIFSLGRLLQFLLRRRAPSSSAARDLAEQPTALRRLVMKATAEDPAHRFADVSALLTALADATEKRWPPASYRIPLILAVVIACLGAGIGYLVRPRPAGLSSSGNWSFGTREALNRMLVNYGDHGPLSPFKKAPLAVLDFDNTVISGDSGDFTVYWMLRTDRIKAGVVLDGASQLLTDDARAALANACSPSPGEDHVRTSDGGRCAKTIWDIYSQTTLGGKPAFKDGYNHLSMRPDYAWGAQLFSGYTPDQVREISAEALAASANAGNKVQLGRLTLDVGVSYRPEMNELIEKLKKSNFDVWILSASPQHVVEVFAEKAGVARDHVIGIQQVIENGALSSKLVSCGEVGDGESAAIPFLEGKTCWMQKKMGRSPPVFAAGDAETDLALLKSATGLRLVFDRHKAPLMCSALAGDKSLWIVNQPFPGGPATERAPSEYPCMSACHDRKGDSVACRDDDDRPMDKSQIPPSVNDNRDP